MHRINRFTRVLVLAGLVAATTSCGDVVRSGRSPVMLVINLLQGLRGAASAGQPSGTLTSDVITNVTSPAPCTAATPCPTVFSDTGRVDLTSVLKDIGSAGAPSAPSTNNSVTITRYHVSYRRTDGRNVQGVDVPYAFDGAVTGTVAAGGTLSLSFELVRSQAKEEAPLIQLKNNPGVVLATIADVTFYGADLVGNDVNVTGSITVEFSNFGDL